MDRTVRVITVLDWWGSTLGIVLVRYCCLGTSLSRNLKCILNILQYLKKFRGVECEQLSFKTRTNLVSSTLDLRLRGGHARWLLDWFWSSLVWIKIKIMMYWSEEDMVGTHLTYLEGSTSSRQTSSLPLIWDWWEVVAGDWWTVGGTWFEKMNCNR